MNIAGRGFGVVMTIV